MTWEMKFSAIASLDPYGVALKIRRPGDWYISGGIETTSDRSAMLSGVGGNGETPEKAVEAMWSALMEVFQAGGYIALKPMSRSERRHVRWNGYMWEDLPLPQELMSAKSGERRD